MTTIRFDAFCQMVRELADQESIAPTTALVDTDELESRANESLSALRDLMIQLQSMEWVETKTKDITTIAGTNRHAVPDDFYMLLDVRGSDGNMQNQLSPWRYQEQAQLRVSGLSPRVWDLRYRLNGRYIEFLPTPASSGDHVYVDYIPAYVPVSGTSMIFEMPYGWWKWAALHAAIDLMAKDAMDGSAGSSLLVEKFKLEDGRIRSLCSMRDNGRAHRIADTRGDAVGDEGRNSNEMFIGLGLPRLWS